MWSDIAESRYVEDSLDTQSIFMHGINIDVIIYHIIRTPRKVYVLWYDAETFQMVDYLEPTSRFMI